MNRMVRLPDWARRSRASSMFRRRSATPALTALRGTKCDEVTLAINRASVVLPLPGGPQRTIDPTRSSSMARRSSCSGPTRCCCPTNSSRVRGRKRAARGWSLAGGGSAAGNRDSCGTLSRLSVRLGRSAQATLDLRSAGRGVGGSLNRLVDLLPEGRLYGQWIVVAVVEPVPDLEGDAPVGARLDPDVRRGILGQVGAGRQALAHTLHQPVQANVSGHLDGERELPGRVAGPVHDRLTEDDRVRDQHLLSVEGPHSGGTELDVLDNAGSAVDGDLVADPKRTLEQEKDPGEKVLQDVLEGEAERQGKDSETAQHECQVAQPDAEENDDRRDHPGHIDQSRRKQADRRVEVGPLELVAREGLNKTAQEEHDQEDDQPLEEVCPGRVPL